MLRFRIRLATVLACFLVAPAAGASVLISEALYDVSGSDNGLVFVEDHTFAWVSGYQRTRVDSMQDYTMSRPGIPFTEASVEHTGPAYFCPYVDHRWDKVRIAEALAEVHPKPMPRFQRSELE